MFHYFCIVSNYIIKEVTFVSAFSLKMVLIFKCFCISVGPKISEMSPSRKEKIRDDVYDAMAEREEGDF